jgi:protein-L-isoaspartate(D-aspartate) O-methyltransferase
MHRQIDRQRTVAVTGDSVRAPVVGPPGSASASCCAAVLGTAAGLWMAGMLWSPSPLAAQADAYAESRDAMVRTQIASGRGGRTPVADTAVLRAMRSVPRHLFVPTDQRHHAYSDRPLPIGYGQTISQPYIVALMTELLGIGPGDVVLEVGTGSGYQAAVLAEIVESVYTIEIVSALASSARGRLAELGYDGVEVRAGDGYYGWLEHAPFDGIVVTAAASHIPPPLEEQLAPGGRMVIPVGAPMQVQSLVLVEKKADGSIVRHSLLPVRFVPLTRRE